MAAKKNNVEGGTPSPASPAEKESKKEPKKSSEQIKQESIRKSEKVNMNNHKGYNETPQNVPIKSGKKKV